MRHLPCLVVLRKEEGLRGSNVLNNDCEACLPQDKELRFYINMDMMGISWPAVMENGDPFPTMPGLDPTLTPKSRTSPSPACSTTSIATSSRRPWTFESKAVMEPVATNTGDDHYNLVMDVHEDTFGRSDHVTFRNLGAQTIFHLGAYDEDYSAYHSPQDTLENMVAVVGGQENLEESYRICVVGGRSLSSCWPTKLPKFVTLTPEVLNETSCTQPPSFFRGPVHRIDTGDGPSFKGSAGSSRLGRSCRFCAGLQ